MLPFDHIDAFSLLNIEGRRLVISNLRNLLDIVISIIFFGNPSKMYMKGLLEVANDILELMFLDEKYILLPRLPRDGSILNVLKRFNDLQKDEEQQILNTLHRINADEPREPPDSTVPPTTKQNNGPPLTRS